MKKNTKRFMAFALLAVFAVTTLYTLLSVNNMVSAAGGGTGGGGHGPGNSGVPSEVEVAMSLLGTKATRDGLVMASNGQVINKDGYPIVVKETGSILFAQQGGSLVDVDKSKYTLTQGGTFVGENGYSICNTGGIENVYVLSLKDGSKFPAIKVNRTEKTYFLGIVIYAKIIIEYYDLCGMLLDQSTYDRRISDLMEWMRKPSEWDFTQPWGTAAESGGVQLVDHLGQAIGVNHLGQLVDPYSRPLIDTDARPVFKVDNGYKDIQGRALTISGTKLLDNAGNPVRSVGGSFNGYVLVMKDGQTMIPVKRNVSATGVITYNDMNGKLFSEDEYIKPGESIEVGDDGRIVRPDDPSVFGSCGDGCASGFNTFLVVLIVLGGAVLIFKGFELFKGKK